MPFNSIFSWMMKKRIHQIDLFRKNPHQVQQELFGYLIRAGATTTYGAINDFKMVGCYDDYRKNIPLQTYEDAKMWIERSMQGEKSLLWPNKTNWFAKSSGTTSRSKILPVTKESLEGCHYKGGKDLLAMYYDNHENRKLYNGKHLIVGGSTEINELSSDSYFGDLSAIIVKNLPWYIEARRTPSKEITLMTDWQEKMQKMAESTIEENVVILAGVPSWTMVLANKVLEISGKKNLKEVWPNLELFMHGGVSFEPYREQFKKLIPDPNMNYVQTYNASEGFFGIQDEVDSDEMLLMLDYGIYYEFIPMNQYEGVNSKQVINIEEVELDVNYALVITTNAGLWRYILGDTIKFTNTLPYRFKITGRVNSFVNCFGEEVIVENSDLAVARASSKTNAQIKEYTVAPIFMEGKEKGAHEWAIEFINAPDNLDEFSKTLDEELQKLNSDYEAKRSHNMILDAPVINVVNTGTFDAWLNSQGKLGGQNKIPRLSNSRDLLEQILEVSNVE
ncbi:MAG TPA: GH3 auxin-responsive promoter family protein [Crocinitomicaceae bacterium]|nr:GH3 auxin-responsive promoter family protein [Crocinitomicaceae bacterium]